MKSVHVIVIQGPDGTIEQFTTRISEQAVAEWLMDRDELRAAGVPDRPPDVDTPSLRGWAVRPGEENLPYFVEEAKRKTLGVFPVMTLRWVNEQRTLILLVTGWLDGGFSVDILDSNMAGIAVHRDYGPDLPPDDVWEQIEHAIETSDRRCQGAALHVTYLWDFDAAEFDLEIARIDFERGFVSPLGEARA